MLQSRAVPGSTVLHQQQLALPGLWICRATGGLASLWIHSHLHLCLHQCSLEADPKSGCCDFGGKTAGVSCNASNLLFPESLFKEKKMFTFKSSSLFCCRMARLVQKPLTAQQDGFHTLCVHRPCSCSSLSWSAHQACPWSAVHGHAASQTVPNEYPQAREGSTALRAPWHGSLRAAGSSSSAVQTPFLSPLPPKHGGCNFL